MVDGIFQNCLQHLFLSTCASWNMTLTSPSLRDGSKFPPIELGTLVIMVEVTLCDFRSLTIEGSVAFECLFGPLTLETQPPCCEKTRTAPWRGEGQCWSTSWPHQPQFLKTSASNGRQARQPSDGATLQPVSHLWPWVFLTRLQTLQCIDELTPFQISDPQNHKHNKMVAVLCHKFGGICYKPIARRINALLSFSSFKTQTSPSLWFYPLL